MRRALSSAVSYLFGAVAGVAVVWAVAGDLHDFTAWMDVARALVKP